MCSKEKMTIDEQRKYLRTMKKRYVRADRKTKAELLNEMEAVTGKHRKSLIRLMNGSLERRPRRKQRERSYGPDVDYALQIIDVATGWSERRAVLGRSQRVMAHAFRRILSHLPFPIRQIHPDNGGEFFSHHLLRLWGDVVQGVHLSRSRPFHKNDNPRVEQKNATLVRAYLGDGRLDSVLQTIALNVLYDQMWVFYNLFQPVMHLAEKNVIREPGKPVRVRRKHDQPTTPFERLCRTSAILPEHKAQLEAVRDFINPRRLREDIYDGIVALFKLPGAAPGLTEDVHLTMLDVEDR